MADLPWWYRCLDYTAVALLACLAVTVAFLVDEHVTLRGRVWSVKRAWFWAAADSATAHTRGETTVITTSTKDTALRLLRDTIGDL